MKQSLQLKLGQQLTMTPQLQQAIRLLQLSTLDLQAEIQEALDSNPMLEVEEDLSGDDSHSGINEQAPASNELNGKDSADGKSDAADANGADQESNSDASSDGDWNEDNIPTDLAVDTSWDDIYDPTPSGTGLAKPDSDDYDFESRRGTSETLQDHLQWQLNLTPMSVRDKDIAEAIIDAVKPNGLLGQTLDEIFHGLEPHHEELEMDEVVAVLHRVQQFDPPGVLSQDVRECLLIQLSQLDISNEDVRNAKTLVSEFLDLLGGRDFKQLMRKLKLKESELQAAVQVIQGLNPRPGEQIGSDDTEYVVPDVFVNKVNNRWMVQLNPDIAPRLRINSDYASLVKRADSSADNTFLRDNLQEARWFLKSLQSRNETLLKVASCIVEKQQGFLDFGPEAMKPMVLHDVAEIVEMHESTISRVTTQKYMHTPQGIFELKYFFSSHVATDSGGECSSTAIRAIIKKLVAAENARKPLSDSKITGLLAEQGIKVARRTIAKYRESLNIPPSNERKRLV
ncbi:RNA polymerase sigma-54 factor [Teredinibacter turnerae T7901]|uniref:RNA polymerase sigma-54 factor n=1 Tax=Teredinibacter turnerae (strain ATCC 39867 / T7901) TaxID=377629 RepID=C5BSX3_TERTT|nr:RNA polymerase factor sigma-54 [Teredinibacter turnerae]ACR13954.1 RNA polymerase sigma-54 factor [Teredinibacter turnerae T7901]